MKYDVKIYTDGCAKGNPGTGGYGIIIQCMISNYKKEFYEGFIFTTNNRMELLAVITGLEKLKKPNTKVLVVSDSRYVVDSVLKNWVFDWEKKDFLNRKNADLWKRFLKVYRTHQIHFEWVKGHNNHPENERCDQLAFLGSKQNNLSTDLLPENHRTDYPY